MRVVICLLFSLPLHATEFVSPAAFTTLSCEQHLQSPEALAKTRDAVQWLGDLEPMTMTIFRWHTVERSADAFNPRAIFFDELAPGTTLEQVTRRYRDARREADRQSQEPASTVIGRRDLAHAALDLDELAALGYRLEDDVSSFGLSARVRSEAGALLFDIENGEHVRTQFRLPINGVVHGFDNAVAAWQVATLDDLSEVPSPTFEPGQEYDLMRKFFGAHGRFVFTKRAAGHTYAYVFDRRVLRAVPNRDSGFDLTVYRVSECDRPAMLEKSSIVLPRRSNGKYPCLTPLGLRFSVPAAGYADWLSPGASFRQAY